MKSLGIFLLVCAACLCLRAAEAAKPADLAKALIISTEYIHRLVAEARTNNPSLKAADSRVRSATLNAAAIRTWEEPTVMLGGSVYSSKGFAPAEDGDLAYGVEQKLPLWNKPMLTRRVAEAETSRQQATVELRVQQLRHDIAKGLLATALAERVVAIGEQDLAWLDAISKATESKYRTGAASVADTLQIQNELAKRNDTLRTDRRRLAHERFTLNRRLNRRADSPWPSLQLPPVGPIVPLSQRLLTLALQNEPRLKVMGQEIKRARAAAELTRQSRFPEVSVGVVGRQYSGDGEFRSEMFALRFTLPWFNRDKYRKEYERDKEWQKAAEEEREDQILMVREVLHHLTVEIEARHREALLYSDEISLRSNQSLTSRLADWEAGRGMFREVVDACRRSLDSELMSARATAEQNEMLAELLLWTGLESMESLAPLANEPALLPDHETH